MREAILQRGLQLHDAFLMFDYDRNGLLSLAEVYGALEWLQVRAARWALIVTPRDVLFFVRTIGHEPHLTYSEFIELLASPETNHDDVVALAAAPLDMAPKGEAELQSDVIRRTQTRVLPKGEAELQSLLSSQLTAERALETALVRTEAELAEQASAPDCD